MSEQLIDPNGEDFQLGRRLYEAQVLHADVTRGVAVDPERVKEVCERYCRLINCVGMLRAEYARLAEELKRLRDGLEALLRAS